MESVVDKIKTLGAQSLNFLFPEINIKTDDIVVNETKPEFMGDYAIVLFPFLKLLRQNPLALGNALGNYLMEHSDFIQSYEIVGGFLNLNIKDEYWINYLTQKTTKDTLIEKRKSGENIMVEYSSPNTNKPLHFGHLRNIFLGWSVSEILKVSGYNVVKANLVNDRGIHICKSMIAWQLYAHGATPESSNIKGDHLVGDYYVKFNEIYKEEVAQMIESGVEKSIAEKEAPLLKKAHELLIKWENGDQEVYDLWKKMNSWVYHGFNQTYNDMGIDFDKWYYESDTYLLGKEIVEKGLEKGVLFKKPNHSVWIDLTQDGLDEKLLLREDGTSVYMTQDLGTAVLKHEEFKLDKSIYVIADEQNYHMQVLKLILQKLGEPSADTIYHLSYGMVELPSGRMKSREGTVVDADDMIEEMVALAKEQTEQAGKTEGFSEEELRELYRIIGLGALKFYLLRVDPKKKMIFDPKESIDLHGYTATFIQYAHARICSILRKLNVKNNQEKFSMIENTILLDKLEKNLLIQLEQYSTVLLQAAHEFNPSVLCNYSFKLAQTFNSFYDKHSIANAETEQKMVLRTQLASLTARTLKHSMSLLGIQVPEKM